MIAAASTGDGDAARFGERLRRLRRSRGLTLVALAEATGLSHPFLSQVERGLANLSMPSLRRVALALETSPVELLSETGSPEIRVEVSRAGERRPTPAGFASGTAQALAGSARPFVPILVEASDGGELFTHAEDEFVYVIAGAITVELDGAPTALGTGDSVYYAGGVAHRWWGEGQLLVVKQRAL